MTSYGFQRRHFRLNRESIENPNKPIHSKMDPRVREDDGVWVVENLMLIAPTLC
ncbi:MAG: hypothetical protein P8J14_10635 [Emcibacteraceae bacterium]|nr:hypothetical protein [Emcibacteraceae bacterium]